MGLLLDVKISRHGWATTESRAYGAPTQTIGSTAQSHGDVIARVTGDEISAMKSRR
jgi:hypothetical protein